MRLFDSSIVPIPPAREKFFGCSGRMLLPTKEVLSALLQNIPAGSLASTGQLQNVLKQAFQVQAVCPVTFRNALRAAADSEQDIPYWRVVKDHGELISWLARQKSQLLAEGLELEDGKKQPKVRHYASHLVSQSVLLNALISRVDPV